MLLCGVLHAYQTGKLIVFNDAAEAYILCQ
jgi:hypothetical protein